MSASLVGSEMCIRDRSSSPRGMSWDSGMGSSTAAPIDAATDGFGSAVSYTHLTLPTICSV
eukprot:15068908-Alexandrium_andersonii.AAC.1